MDIYEVKFSRTTAVLTIEADYFNIGERHIVFWGRSGTSDDYKKTALVKTYDVFTINKIGETGC